MAGEDFGGNGNFGFDFMNQGPSNYVSYADPVLSQMTNQNNYFPGSGNLTDYNPGPSNYVMDPNRGSSSLNLKDIVDKIAKSLSSLGGSGAGDPSKLPFGTPQGPQLAGAPRAYDFNGGGFSNKVESPADYASRGSGEFMKFLSFLRQIAPLLYGDQGQGMRMGGRG